VCSAGQCALTCVGGTSLCGGACVDTKLDAANCGACGKACPAGQVCSAGQCALTCVGGTSLCGGACVDTKADAANCGACGKACAAGQVCSAGTCALTCGGGATLCGNACVDTKLDPANCGGCGKACAAGQVCSAGACALTCVGGSTKCGNLCVDTKDDPANCGACGKACAANQACVSGACVQTKFAFALTQTIDGQTVTCSKVDNSNPLYTECDDLKEGGFYFPNGISCNGVWSLTNSSYSDTIGFCQSLTGTAKAESFFTCNQTQTRTTWKNHVWGTFQDNGYTQNLRCYY
jgi:hypothetical protein